MTNDTNKNDTTPNEEKEAAYEAMMGKHVAEIVRVFGEEAANSANIGWGDSGTCVCSKIYGKGLLFTTYDEQTFAVLGHRTHWARQQTD